MNSYKFLDKNKKGTFTDFDFNDYLPKEGQPGKWLPKISVIWPGEVGYHFPRYASALTFSDHFLYEVELGEELKRNDQMIVTNTFRFLQPVKTWNIKNHVLFVKLCVNQLPKPDNQIFIDLNESCQWFVEGKISLDKLEEVLAKAKTRQVERTLSKIDWLQIVYAAFLKHPCVEGMLDISNYYMGVEGPLDRLIATRVRWFNSIYQLKWEEPLNV